MAKLALGDLQIEFGGNPQEVAKPFSWDMLKSPLDSPIKDMTQIDQSQEFDSAHVMSLLSDEDKDLYKDVLRQEMYEHNTEAYEDMHIREAMRGPVEEDGE